MTAINPIDFSSVLAASHREQTVMNNSDPREVFLTYFLEEMVQLGSKPLLPGPTETSYFQAQPEALRAEVIRSMLVSLVQDRQNGLYNSFFPEDTSSAPSANSEASS